MPRRALLIHLVVALGSAGCAHQPSRRAVESYITLYNATCPAPDDVIWIRPQGATPVCSTPALRAREARLLAHLERKRAELDRCAALPAARQPSIRVGPSGVAFRDAGRAEKSGEAETCMLELLRASHVEAIVAGPVVLQFENVTEPSSPSGLKGHLRRDEVKRIIDEHTDEIRECFEAAIGVWGPFDAKVAVQFWIGADGKVTGARVVREDGPAAPLGCCMTSRIARWRFPQPTGGGVVCVNYPWVFRVAPEK